MAGWVANAIDPTLERAAQTSVEPGKNAGSEPLAVFPSFRTGARTFAAENTWGAGFLS